MSHEYENVRRIVTGPDADEYAGASFVPVCVKCGRFVKADAVLYFQHDTLASGSNATCSKCGRTEMLFEGFI